MKKYTIVIKSPNSGFSSNSSPSENTSCLFLDFLADKTICICCAATDKTGSSILLNSSKHPQEPDCAKPTTNQLNYINTENNIQLIIQLYCIILDCFTCQLPVFIIKLNVFIAPISKGIEKIRSANEKYAYNSRQNKTHFLQLRELKIIYYIHL